MQKPQDKSNTCPYCGREMEPGWIQCRDGVAWSRKKRPVAAMLPVGEDALVLADGGGIFSGTAVPAGRCPRCKKIVIDYG